jgi:hypothetical protein
VWYLGTAAEVEQTRPPAVRFWVEPPGQWDRLLADRVEHHFDAFLLAKLYAAQAAGYRARIAADPFAAALIDAGLRPPRIADLLARSPHPTDRTFHDELRRLRMTPLTQAQRDLAVDGHLHADLQLQTSSTARPTCWSGPRPQQIARGFTISYAVPKPVRRYDTRLDSHPPSPSAKAGDRSNQPPALTQ